MNKIKITIAQLQYEPGAIDKNCNKIISAYQKAVQTESDLIIFSELAVIGYPPDESVLQLEFQMHCAEAIQKLATATEGHSTFMLVGGIWSSKDNIYNTMFLLGHGQIFTSIGKHSTELSSLYNEARLFTATALPKTIMIDGVKINVIIGSDVSLYQLAGLLTKTGVEIIIAVNSYPYSKQSNIYLSETISKINKETSLPIIYINQVGSSGTYTIKGGSFIVSASGKTIYRLPEWEECIAHTEWQKTANTWECINGPQNQMHNEIESTHRAMLSALTNFIQQNSFSGILIHLTPQIGSIISAVVASNLAPNFPTTAFMLDNELNNSLLVAIAKELDITDHIIKPSNYINAAETSLNTENYSSTNDQTLQAKLISCVLDGIAKERNLLLLSDADKTDVALGDYFYKNIFAQYSLVGDIYKTDLYKIAKWYNTHKPQNTKIKQQNFIPKQIVAQENAKHHTGVDLQTLDSILNEMIENNLSHNEVIKLGYDTATTKMLASLLIKASPLWYKTTKPLCLSGKILGVEWQPKLLQQQYRQNNHNL